jgi:hypothetical protein
VTASHTPLGKEDLAEDRKADPEVVLSTLAPVPHVEPSKAGENPNNWVISRGALIAEGAVDELRGRGSILVRAEPLATARETAERLVGTDRVEVLDGTLRLDSDAADAPRITRELVLAGVAVSEVRPVERTLEDVFLQLTGGGRES